MSVLCCVYWMVYERRYSLIVRIYATELSLVNVLSKVYCKWCWGFLWYLLDLIWIFVEDKLLCILWNLINFCFVLAYVVIVFVFNSTSCLLVCIVVCVLVIVLDWVLIILYFDLYMRILFDFRYVFKIFEVYIVESIIFFSESFVVWLFKIKYVVLDVICNGDEVRVFMVVLKWIEI